MFSAVCLVWLITVNTGNFLLEKCLLIGEPPGDKSLLFPRSPGEYGGSLMKDMLFVIGVFAGISEQSDDCGIK